jgi:hypothetical protein
MTMYQDQVGQVSPSIADRLAEHVERLVEFHESQIVPGCNEEDVEMRERQIIQLQQEFSEVRAVLMRG